jgi:hypothetical protein
LLKAALPATAEPGTPLAITAGAPGCRPLLCARSPTAGFDTSWQVPQKSTERWKLDCRNWCLGLVSA